MLLFRISRAIYAEKPRASGLANRWNLAGQFVLYAASSRSLATLEMLVRRSAISPMQDYKMVLLECSEEASFRTLQNDLLPKNWRSLAAYSTLQSIGSAWYTANTSLLLKIPSAVIPQEENYMINSQHPDYIKYIKIRAIEDYFWDSRLFNSP